VDRHRRRAHPLKAIGVFGGTFAPIHNGHLRLAIEARELLGLDEVRLIPAAAPPLRDAPAISGARRLRWVELAIRGERGLRADDRELARPGPSYTIDTLASLRLEFPDASLCLLLGQDAARTLPRWHRWRELIGLAHLVFFARPGQPATLPAALAAVLRGRRTRAPGTLRRRRAGQWLAAPLAPLDISGTDLRRRLGAGLSVRGLVADTVVADFTRKDLEAFRRS
jgi:nicotinate-nucleotide adenylyltransferase